MILPISKAFQSLKTRLDCISNHYGGSFELPLAQKTSSQKTYFFGEDYNMKATIEEAIAQVKDGGASVLSLEECLNNFDDRLIQCNAYFREMAQKEFQK